MRLVDYSKCRATTEAAASEDLEHSLTSFHAVVQDQEQYPNQRRRSSASSSRTLQAILQKRQSNLTTTIVSSPADTSSSFGLHGFDSALAVPTSPVSRRNTVGHTQRSKHVQARRASVPPVSFKTEEDDPMSFSIRSFNAVWNVVVNPLNADKDTETENEVIEVQLAPSTQQQSDEDDATCEQQISSLVNLHDSQPMLDNSQLDDSQNDSIPLRRCSSTPSNHRRRKMIWLANQPSQKDLSAKATNSGGRPISVVKFIHPKQEHDTPAAKPNDPNHFAPTLSSQSILQSLSWDESASSNNYLLDKSCSLRVLAGPNTNPQNALVLTTSVRRSSASFVAGSRIRTYQFQ